MKYNIAINLPMGKFCSGCRFSVTQDKSHSKCVLWDTPLLQDFHEDGFYTIKCLDCYELELKEGMKEI